MRPLQLEVAESSTGRTVIVKLRGGFDMSVEFLFAETVTEGVVQNGHSAVVLDLFGGPDSSAAAQRLTAEAAQEKERLEELSKRIGYGREIRLGGPALSS